MHKQVVNSVKRKCQSETWVATQETIDNNKFYKACLEKSIPKKNFHYKKTKQEMEVNKPGWNTK